MRSERREVVDVVVTRRTVQRGRASGERRCRRRKRPGGSRAMAMAIRVGKRSLSATFIRLHASLPAARGHVSPGYAARPHRPVQGVYSCGVHRAGVRLPDDPWCAGRLSREDQPKRKPRVIRSHGRALRSTSRQISMAGIKNFAGGFCRTDTDWELITGTSADCAD
jgi:hypothetical protein